MIRPTIALAATLALAGCAARQEPVAISAPPIATHVPAAALTCAPEPSGRGVTDDRAAARYVTALAAAGRDCRNKLGAASEILRGER